MIGLFSRMAKNHEVYSRNNSGSKTLPCRIPDTTLINQFTLQPSTITWCDWIDRNYVNTDNIEAKIPTTELIENSLMVDPIKGCVEVNLHNSSNCLLSSALCNVWDTHKSDTQTFPISKLGGCRCRRNNEIKTNFLYVIEEIKRNKKNIGWQKGSFLTQSNTLWTRYIVFPE